MHHGAGRAWRLELELEPSALNETLLHSLIFLQSKKASKTQKAWVGSGAQGGVWWVMACFLFGLIVGIGSSLVFLVRSLGQDMFDVFKRQNTESVIFELKNKKRERRVCNGVAVNSRHQEARETGISTPNLGGGRLPQWYLGTYSTPGLPRTAGLAAEVCARPVAEVQVLCANSRVGPLQSRLVFP